MDEAATALPQPTEPAKAPLDHLRESFLRKQQVKTQDLMVPGYDELHVVFRMLDDYTELRRTLRGSEIKNRFLQPDQREIQSAIDTMLLASVDSYAVVEGAKVPIGLPLGVALYDRIFPPDHDEDPDKPSLRPSKDGEAVSMLFGGDTVALMFFASQLDVAQKMASARAEDDLLGE